MKNKTEIEFESAKKFELKGSIPLDFKKGYLKRILEKIKKRAKIK